MDQSVHFSRNRWGKQALNVQCSPRWPDTQTQLNGLLFSSLIRRSIESVTKCIMTSPSDCNKILFHYLCHLLSGIYHVLCVARWNYVQKQNMYIDWTCDGVHLKVYLAVWKYIESAKVGLGIMFFVLPCQDYMDKHFGRDPQMLKGVE